MNGDCLYMDQWFLFKLAQSIPIKFDFDIMWCDQAKRVWTQKRYTLSVHTLYASISELYHAENPIKIEHTVKRYSSILEMLKTIKYKGNWMLLLALSKNQY